MMAYSGVVALGAAGSVIGVEAAVVGIASATIVVLVAVSTVPFVVVLVDGRALLVVDGDLRTSRD